MPTFHCVRCRRYSQKMLKLLLSGGLLATMCAGWVNCACEMAVIRTDANSCLTENDVAAGVEFLAPVLADASAVTHFCTTKLSAIKDCIKNVLDTCKSDVMVRKIFGTISPLMAAYDGICSEATAASDLVCAVSQKAAITIAVDTFKTAVDALADTSTDTCTAVATLHTSLTAAVSGCSTSEKAVYEKFYSTGLDFPCLDLATEYYPCTIGRVNTDAIACYSASSVTVTNGFVPTPTTAHANVMCTAKETIKTCLKTLAETCRDELQLTVLANGAATYRAAIDCMCSLADAADVLSCPNGADVATGMTTFTGAVHAKATAGSLTAANLCSDFAGMKTTVTTAMEGTCADTAKRGHWATFMATLEYPCQQVETDCYAPSAALRATPVVGVYVYLLYIVASVTCFMHTC